ncbi:MAG TPA: ABC transporter permease [Terriglobia bacterium]|nr:ABC transporter permease [Terriglobia bacterium]
MLLRRGQFDADLDEEMGLHRELREQAEIERGLAPKEAHYAARRRFGNVLVLREESRDMWGWNWLEDLWKDVRYGLRILRKNPGFTAVAVITLALGIGANTAIFTLVDAVMLRALPVANPGQLYRLGDNNNCCVMTGTQNGDSYVLYSYPLYENLRDRTPEFSEMAAFTPFLIDLSVRRSHVSSPAEPYNGQYVSGNYFSMFGVRAIAGRALMASDDKPGAPPTAVMNYHTWQRQFGSDPSVIGTTFTINTVPYTVVGVAPPGFYGDTLRSDPPDFWLPLAAEPLMNPLRSRLHRDDLEWLYLMGNLKPGAEARQAQSHLTAELQQWLWSTGYAQATPEQRNDRALVEQYRQEIAKQHVHLTPASGGVNKMQEDYAAGLRLLETLSGLVLLIACANIASLLLARGVASRLQTAVRLALGAPRRRLIRQMLTESVLLALAGGAAGLYVAYAGTHVILLLAFRGAHYVPIDPRPSLPVLGFALLLSLVTGIVFGVAPAWIASRSDPAETLRGAGRSTRDRSSWAQKPLVILQVTLSTILLIGAGLLTQSLRNLENQHFGFATQGRLIVRVDPALARYTPQKLGGLYQQIEQGLTQVPGVLSASLSGYSPLSGDNWSEYVYMEGHPPDLQGVAPSWDRVGPHYFETIGTRLIRGRVFEESDTPAAPHVAVINQAFARRFFPKEDPIGQHFGMGTASHSGDYEIVGIVEDAKYQDTRGPAYPTFFLPLLQAPYGISDGSIYIHDIELRTAGNPENLEASVRKTLAGIDPNLTILGMMSFAEQVSLNFNQDRLIARLTELFGLLALTLACVGLYGVTAFSVARRTNEIGIRMALGADRVKVLGMVLQGAALQVALGLAFGIPVALAGSRMLSSILYGVKSYDSLILLLAAAILSACALIAGFIPARRAAKVDPMVALRYE